VLICVNQWLLPLFVVSVVPLWFLLLPFSVFSVTPWFDSSQSDSASPMRRATRRPDFNMPPKMGPMRGSR